MDNILIIQWFVLRDKVEKSMREVLQVGVEEAVAKLLEQWEEHNPRPIEIKTGG